MQVAAMLEDKMLTAVRSETNWTVTISDSFTGRQESLVMTDNQFAAVMALAIADDDSATFASLYAYANDGLRNINTDLRIIP